MTYNEKKSLYESIMKDIAKTVKRKINEAGVASLADSIHGLIVDTKNDIKVEFDVKSTSKENSMFYYNAIVMSSLQG